MRFLWRWWMLRRLAKELLAAGWQPDDPKTLDAVIDKIRQQAAADGRSVREAESNIELLLRLSAEPPAPKEGQ